MEEPMVVHRGKYDSCEECPMGDPHRVVCAEGRKIKEQCADAEQQDENYCRKGILHPVGVHVADDALI